MVSDDRREATRVLVVRDSSASARASDVAALVRAGCAVQAPEVDLDSALERAQHLAPDLAIVLTSTGAPPSPALESVISSLHVARLAPVLVWQEGAPTDGEMVERCARAGASAYLVGAQGAQALRAAIQVCLARWQELVAAESALNRLRGEMHRRVTIHRGVGALMGRLGISEETAYRQIQKSSMDERLPATEIAEAILVAVQARPEARPGRARRAAPLWHADPPWDADRALDAYLADLEV